MKNGLTVGLLALAVHAVAAAGQDQAKSAGTKVSVKLSFTVDEYDPKAPKGTMKCVVHNGTNQAIEVPVGYGGRGVSVTGSGVTLYRRLQPGEEGVKFVVVEPGKDQEIFDLPLGDLLKGERKSNSPWRWSWMKRSQPPLTPIHKHRAPGYVDQATFLATVEFRGQTLKSNAAVLKVKTGE